MQANAKLPDDIQRALSNGLLERIPLTFLPFVNQQLDQWENLFPNERKSVERLLLYVSSLSPEQSAGLFRRVVELEEKMGVRKWKFSTREQTIQNSSQLASSPYFQDWRSAVQAVFDASDRYAIKENAASAKVPNRLVLIDLPPHLPLDAATVWRRWREMGRPIQLDLSHAGSSEGALGLLVCGQPEASLGEGILDAARNRPLTTAADTWLIDAGLGLVDRVLARPSTGQETAIVLGYGRLDRYRQSFSREMNSMHKDLADADAVFDRLRKVDVTQWCPPEMAAAPATREFVRSLYLTGNGAVIYGNSFVEWAASEAFRRARPTFLAAQFGVRSKPKPFTGVAVFDNPDQINPLPAVDDLPGSAADAQMLALYVWLAASRFEEYQRSTVCICLAEGISQAYVVAPPEFDLENGPGPISLDRLRSTLAAWMA